MDLLDILAKFSPVLQLLLIPAVSKIWQMDTRLTRVEAFFEALKK